MTHFLSSDKNPGGHKLEDVLKKIRNDVLYRATKIMEDNKPEAQRVLSNNVKIIAILEDAIKLSEDSTQTLDRSFGSSQPGSPRIGSD